MYNKTDQDAGAAGGAAAGGLLLKIRQYVRKRAAKDATEPTIYLTISNLSVSR